MDVTETRDVPQQCREPTVEEVRNKERANFCDHYKPVAGAFKGGALGATIGTVVGCPATIVEGAYVSPSRGSKSIPTTGLV